MLLKGGVAQVSTQNRLHECCYADAVADYCAGYRAESASGSASESADASNFADAK